MSEETARHRVLSLGAAHDVLREIAGEVEAAYCSTTPSNAELRKSLARRMIALEMGAQALAIAEVEEKRNAARASRKLAPVAGKDEGPPG